MSTDDATSQPEATLPQSWMQRKLQRVLGHWADLRLGHEAMMLDKIQRQTRIVEQVAKNTVTGRVHDVDVWPGSDGDDSMGVNIGDHIHYHSPPESAKPNGISTLGKLAVGAALLASGLGGGMALMNALQPSEKASASADSWIEYSGRAWNPGEAPTYTTETDK